MKKAEQIFKDTRYSCFKSIKQWGLQTNEDGSAVGFNRLTTDEAVCTRTLNDVQKEIKRAAKTLTTDIRLGVVSKEKAKREAEIISMVQATLNNHRKHL